MNVSQEEVKIAEDDLKARQEELQQQMAESQPLSDNIMSNAASIGQPPESLKMFSASSEKDINPAFGYMTVRNVHEINWDLLRKQSKEEWADIKQEQYDIVSKLVATPAPRGPGSPMSKNASSILSGEKAKKGKKKKMKKPSAINVAGDDGKKEKKHKKDKKEKKDKSKDKKHSDLEVGKMDSLEQSVQPDELNGQVQHSKDRDRSNSQMRKEKKKQKRQDKKKISRANKNPSYDALDHYDPSELKEQDKLIQSVE